MWRVVSSPDVGAIPQVLKIASLETEQGLVHGFSTSLLGTMGLTHAPDPEAGMASPRQFAPTPRVECEPPTGAGAMHGNGGCPVGEAPDVGRGVEACVTDPRR